ncbi:hypothetical protein ACH5RR_029326 [Cinchona calisaya]|uniref:Uncharacterized protein n=1 Tax=Cinchona calisaya TaxID=153742 RepID=A0ABD2YUV9_9GENT
MLVKNCWRYLIAYLVYCYLIFWFHVLEFGRYIFLLHLYFENINFCCFILFAKAHMKYGHVLGCVIVDCSEEASIYLNLKPVVQIGLKKICTKVDELYLLYVRTIEYLFLD